MFIQKLNKTDILYNSLFTPLHFALLAFCALSEYKAKGTTLLNGRTQNTTIMEKHEKFKLVNELLPFVIEMAAAQNAGKVMCSLPVTIKDLMALTDAELQELEKMVSSSRSTKKAQEKAGSYEKHFSGSSEQDFKIIC